MTELISPDTRTAVQKSLEKPLAFISSDADKIYEYMQRFKIRTTVWEAPSLNSRVKEALDDVECIRVQLNNITLKEELEGKIRHKLNLRLYRSLRFYSRLKNFAAGQENPDTKPVKIGTSGKSFLRVTIGATDYEVGVKGDRIMANQIAIREASAFWKPVSMFSSFKDMGNPKFYVIHRRKRYDLNL
jgi:hypothetical protein